MAHTGIEVAAAPGQPLGMPPARFLRDCWQKRPLLIRGAFPQFHNAIEPEDLAGLACEDGVLARLVLRDAKRDRWRVRSGPFRESDFARLPKASARSARTSHRFRRPAPHPPRRWMSRLRSR